MNTVIIGCDAEAATGDADGSVGGDPVGSGVNLQFPARNVECGERGEPVIRADDVQRSGLHVEVSRLAGRSHAVVPCLNTDCRIRDAQVLIRVQAVPQRLYLNIAAGDDKIVVPGNPVSGCG